MATEPFQWPQLEQNQLDAITSSALDQDTYEAARLIVDDVQHGGVKTLQEYAVRFGDRKPSDPLVLLRHELEAALESLPDEQQQLLRRTTDRIRGFAIAQRAALADIDNESTGGRAGHRWLPLRVAGCYAPGGKYPLPSSVLMTAVTASAAGVESIWVASPNPNPVVLAAAAIAGAEAVLAVGGAQAIAALAHGIPDLVPRCDVVAGPGNRFVTAAKAYVSRSTRIDMLAGPSELVVAAAGDGKAEWVAADLMAQAEHDEDARAILVTTSADFAEEVARELHRQLDDLPTASVARRALARSGFVVVEDVQQAIACCERIAPEHLSLQGATFSDRAEAFTSGAALFIGGAAAQVFGDYGAGPNHVLPTSGHARRHSPLSVATFLRQQTFLRMGDAGDQTLTADAAALARLEGLEAHARSAEKRIV